MKTAKEIADSLRWLANSRVRELTPGMLEEKHHESIANAIWMVADQVESFQADAAADMRERCAARCERLAQTMEIEGSVAEAACAGYAAKAIRKLPLGEP